MVNVYGTFWQEHYGEILTFPLTEMPTYITGILLYYYYYYYYYYLYLYMYNINKLERITNNNNNNY